VQAPLRGAKDQYSILVSTIEEAKTCTPINKSVMSARATGEETGSSAVRAHFRALFSTSRYQSVGIDFLSLAVADFVVNNSIMSKP
jgi:hypothetical protein